MINDIVFQTRLLSFNASVEAARAGEQGKGFAVVAEEVGNLAQMSGSSARDIQSMLDSSVRLVDTIVKNATENMFKVSETGKAKISAGLQNVERCSSILQEILENASLVEHMSTEISLACQEQSEGIAEINLAMNEMDSAAHQNSAACEKTSASAEQLKAHATKLLAMVSQLETVIYGDQARKKASAIASIKPQITANVADEWDEAA